MDPNLKYDLVVNTIPQIEKKGIVLQKNTHNTIPVDCPQGYIKLRYTNANKNYPIDARIIKKGDTKTLNTQFMGSTDKYLIGSYQLEILTLPRIYKTLEVTQSSTETIDIAAPGQLT